MKKILALSGSNSSKSINQKWVSYVAGRMDAHEVKLINLRDYDIPMYSEDLESERGHPVDIKVLFNLIAEHDALLISVNEHNGGPSAFFKNITDWLSRVELKFLADKKVLLMSTSPGKRGAASSLTYYKGVLPRFGAQVVENFSLPSFHENFKDGKIADEVLLLGLNDVIATFERELED